MDVANSEAKSVTKGATKGMGKNATRSLAKRKRKLFYATVQVTRVEDWCVEAESAEEARALLVKGEGERFRLGDCVHLEVHDVTE
jgi:NAD(P)-dependent dehydrogenase (short-subunit alcohol dehydrogenase family)